ncbi:type I-E CRISPR-associated protein Cse1/CasA [Acidithiobacillus sp. MC6.1]|nr:type I-E CRISPR-associated protein Cse1/CasA [Acidithiobacillus sp. MC6.1]
MSTENRFNLIDEPWIPIVDAGRVSLRQLFSQPDYQALGGNSVQKIALTKLLLAISQSAYTPDDDDDWAQLGSDGLARKCLEYLENWRGRFYLYGEKPFLQMPAIKAASIQNFGAVLAEISTGNTTVLTQCQVEKRLTEADKCLLIVQLMGFGLGGKKTDNSITISPTYQGKLNGKGKPSTGKPGASIGFLGYLHNFVQGTSLIDSLWLNLFTKEQIVDLTIYPLGMGVAPWEQMPASENCPVAENLKSSLMGRLVPLSRFCLLAENGLHYSEGIAHLGYKGGMIDPSISVDFTLKDPKAVWVDPEKRPWRLLTALLSFFAQGGFDCYQLRLTIPRAKLRLPTIGIWSGGLRVSSNAGEQFVSGSDDFVESIIHLQTGMLGDIWFANLHLEMDDLDHLSKIIYGATFNYFKTQNMETKEQAAQASNLFWQLCERQFQQLVDACNDAEQARALRPTFARFVHKAYDTYCAKDTARQLDAWAKNRPDLRKYLHNHNKEAA